MRVFANKRILVFSLQLFCFIQIFEFASYVQFFITNEYLPSPFFYVKSDVFMDLFNLLYWSDNDGRYTEWLSVYPPLVFLFAALIKAAFLEQTYLSSAFELRDVGFSVEVLFLVLFLIIPYMILRTYTWKVFTKYEKLLFYIAFLISTPMLFTFERGNLIILTLILLALAISQSGLYRCIFIALLINIKPYFVLLALLFLIKQKWTEFLFCMGFAGGIFLITGILIDNNFLLFFDNILHFSGAVDVFSLREISSMPSSISAYSFILSSENFQNSGLLNSLPNPMLITNLIESVKWVVILFAIYSLFTSSKDIADTQVIAVLVLLISNLGTSVGGYTLIFYFTLIPIFWAMRFKWVYLIILGLIYSSMNIFPVVQDNIGIQYSYLSNSSVSVDWLLDINNLAKPMFNIILLILLSYEILIGYKTKNQVFQTVK